MPGGTELILIAAVIFLLFGGKKLPELARSLGKSSREFKKGVKEGADPDEAEEAPTVKAQGATAEASKAEAGEVKKAEDKPEA